MKKNLQIYNHWINGKIIKSHNLNSDPIMTKNNNIENNNSTKLKSFSTSRESTTFIDKDNKLHKINDNSNKSMKLKNFSKINQKFINKIFFQNVNNKNIINDKNKINTSVTNDTFDKTFKLSHNKSLNNEDSVTKNIKDDNYNNNIIATNENIQGNVVDNNLSNNNSNYSNLYENVYIPNGGKTSQGYYSINHDLGSDTNYIINNIIPIISDQDVNMADDMTGINNQSLLKRPLSPETFSNVTNDVSRPKYDVSNNEKMVFTIYSDIPNSYKEAINCPNKNNWYKAIQD